MGPDLADLGIRLVLASFLGALIGLERELHGRPAGFRTHLLVSLGAALFVITSIGFHRIYGQPGLGAPGVDPARVAAQVVAGIGFLGAGAIIREGNSVRGLTTAACLWVAAAVGVACGIRLFEIALFVTAISLGALLLLKRIEAVLKRDHYTPIVIWAEAGERVEETIGATLTARGVERMTGASEVNVERNLLILEYEIRYRGDIQRSGVLQAVAGLPGVKRVRLGRMAAAGEA